MGMATALAAARLAIVYSINIHSTTYVKTPDQPQAMPRRTKQEAQQTRHALLDAAELVFERRGVAGTSLQEVAAAAGLTRGAVYWHFRDKADLFNAMMPFEQHWLQPAADPLARLRDVLVDILRQVALDERLRRVFTISTQKVEYVGELDAIRERHLRVYQQALRRIEGLLRQAAAAGQLAPGVLPKATARTVHALVHGLIVDWMLDPKAFDLQRAGRGAVLQLLRAVSREPART